MFAAVTLLVQAQQGHREEAVNGLLCFVRMGRRGRGRGKGGETPGDGEGTWQEEGRGLGEWGGGGGRGLTHLPAMTLLPSVALLAGFQQGRSLHLKLSRKSIQTCGTTFEAKCQLAPLGKGYFETAVARQ